MLDVGCWMLDVGCWMLDVGCWMLDVGCWMLDVGCWMLDVGSSPRRSSAQVAKEHTSWLVTPFTMKTPSSFLGRSIFLAIVSLFACFSSSASIHEVGLGKTFSSLSQVPWETLQAGDTVLVYYRTNAYHDKFVLCRRGTSDAPITIRGVLGPN